MNNPYQPGCSVLGHKNVPPFVEFGAKYTVSEVEGNLLRLRYCDHWFHFDNFMPEDALAEPAPPPFGPHLLNALCWVVQTTFPLDLFNGLHMMGCPDGLAREIHIAYSMMSNRNILEFYEDYAYANDNLEWQKWLAMYLEYRCSEYVTPDPHNPAVSPIVKDTQL